MNFSIFDLYQSECCETQTLLHIPCVHSHQRASKQESPDSMKWEDEEETAREEATTKENCREGTVLPIIELERPSLAVSYWVTFSADVSLQKPSLQQAYRIKSKRLSEVHSYTENKKYWDWMRSRAEMLQSSLYFFQS